MQRFFKVWVEKYQECMDEIKKIKGATEGFIAPTTYHTLTHTHTHIHMYTHTYVYL